MHMYVRKNITFYSSNLGSLEEEGVSNTRVKLLPQKFKNSVKMRINRNPEQKIRSVAFHSSALTEAYKCIILSKSSRIGCCDQTTEKTGVGALSETNADVHVVSNPPHYVILCNRLGYCYCCCPTTEKTSFHDIYKTSVDILFITNRPHNLSRREAEYLFLLSNDPTIKEKTDAGLPVVADAGVCL